MLGILVGLGCYLLFDFVDSLLGFDKFELKKENSC